MTLIPLQLSPEQQYEPPKPWERQPNEGGRAFAAFQIYRDQQVNERSLRRVAATVGKSLTQIGRWSSTHGWVDRVTAWDDEKDRLARQTFEEEQRKFTQRLAAAGALMQSKGLGKIRTYVDRFDRDGNQVVLRQGQTYVDELSPRDAAMLIEAGARLEQIGRGLPAAESPAVTGESGTGKPAPVSVSIISNPIVNMLSASPGRVSEAMDVLDKLAGLLGDGAPAAAPNIPRGITQEPTE